MTIRVITFFQPLRFYSVHTWVFLWIMPSIWKCLNAGSNVLHICGFESYSLTALSKRLYPSSFPPLLHQSSCFPQQCEKVSTGYHPYIFCQSSKHFVFISNFQINSEDEHFFSFLSFLSSVNLLFKASLLCSYSFFFHYFPFWLLRISFILQISNPLTVK